MANHSRCFYPFFLFSRFFSIIQYMSYECRHLRNTFCNKRKKECDPGAPGCDLRGRFVFPFSESANDSNKKKPKKDKD